MRRSTPLLVLSAAALAAVTVAAPAQAGGRPLSTDLAGANEVGTAGDPDATGTADITVNPGTGEVCYEITLTGADPVILGHIHEAPAGSNGGVVVDFSLTQDDFVDGTAAGCVVVDRGLAKEILTDSEGYYVNVHSTAFPAGAVRGQL
jgi:hypothetical protein